MLDVLSTPLNRGSFRTPRLAPRQLNRMPFLMAVEEDAPESTAKKSSAISFFKEQLFEPQSRVSTPS